MTASARDGKLACRARTVRKPENIERVGAAVIRSSEQSTVARNISNRHLHQTLHVDLNYRPYKIQIVQELSDRDFILRMEFCNEFIHLMNEGTGIIRHLIMSDEAHFELSGSVNKLIMRTEAFTVLVNCM
ncbi:hypothetical protein ANN_08817 [Periplaneta americana]|uniref:Uncharacterized protein n=1 Tax=Periplaneta americana TaxID=6978 RepID=A0ABQ8T2I5_PERAM|nr:hypothetical protein ANN_08817 [Periplaneta americana]